MKKKLKRLTALVLAMAMAMSLLCTSAWAAEIDAGDGISDTSEVETEEAGEEKLTEESVMSESAEEYEDVAAAAAETAETEKLNTANGSGTCGDNVTWTFSNGTLTISGTGKMSDYDYPEYSPWSDSRSEIITVVINSGVTSIGDWAFYNCTSLTSVTIPDTVTTIGEYAFAECYSLTSVTIPDTVTTIGDHAFGWCESLTSVTIPDSVTTIERYAFSSCSSLTSVTIPDSVTTIGDKAFYNCSSLTSVTIPDSVTSIGVGAFEYCTSLTSVTIPNSVTSIGDYTFYNCSILTSVTIPDSVTSIGEAAFYYCGSLTSVTIPDGVTSIGYAAFCGCSSLTDVYYSGSEEDWSKISIDSSNTYLTNATIHYNSTGSEENNTDTENYFVLGRDNNIFHHTSSDFYNDEEEKNYQTAYASKLLGGLDRYQDSFERSKIIKALQKAWTGSCFGASVSMVLNNRGMLTLFQPLNYYQLGKPKDNTALRDVINYYHLIQYLDDYSEDCQTTSSDFTNLLTTNVSEARFLKKLKEEAERSQQEKKAFIFGYSTDYYYVATTKAGKHFVAKETDGHTILVCGYAYGDFDNDGTSEHQIKMYDLNYGLSESGDSIDYNYMYIADDYSSFDFQDRIMKSNEANEANYVARGLLDGEVDGSHYRLEHVWKQMDFIGIDTLENSSIYQLTDSGTFARSQAGLMTASNSAQQAEISIPAYVPFILENAEGEVLKYNGDNYSGTMEISSIKYIGDTDIEILLSVNASDNFTLTDFEDGFELSAEIGGKYYMASTVGADKILLSNTDGVVIEGDTYTFSAAVSTDLDACELVEFSGETSGTCKLEVAEEGIYLNTDNDCSNVEVETYQDVEYSKSTLNNTGTSVSVTDSSDGGIDIFAEEPLTVDLTDCTITLSVTSYTYDGTAKTPAVTVKNGDTTLTEGTDYTVSYSDNINAGTATVTVTGIGSYTGEVTEPFTIKQAANTISAKNFTKTYSTKKQTFSIGANSKSSGKITYTSNNKYITVDKTTGKVTVKAKYIGTATITIKVAAKGNYANATKKITVTVTPTKTTLSSVTNAKGKKLTVKWKKNTVGTGYQIQYSTSKTFATGNKTATITKKTTTSKTISGLKKGKTYYVRIRTYKTVSGKKIYSAWSTKKSVKIKK